MLYNHNRPASVIVARSASNWERSLGRRTTSSSPPTRYATPTTTCSPDLLDVRHIRRPGKPRPGNCSSGTCRSSGSPPRPQSGRRRADRSRGPVKDGRSRTAGQGRAEHYPLRLNYLVGVARGHPDRPLPVHLVGDRSATTMVQVGSRRTMAVAAPQQFDGHAWRVEGGCVGPLPARHRVDRGTNRIAALDVAL